MLFHLIRKDLLLFFQDRRGMIMGFLVPIALITLFAFIFGGVIEEDEDDQAIQLTVGMNNPGMHASRFCDSLEAMPELMLRRTEIDTARKWVQEGKRSMALILSPGFDDSMQKGSTPRLEWLYDESASTEASISFGMLQAGLSRYLTTPLMSQRSIQQFDKQNPAVDSQTRRQIHKQIQKQYAVSAFDSLQSQLITMKTIKPEKPISPGLIHAVAGTSIMMLLFSVVGMGTSLLEEQEKGTLRRLLLAPLHPLLILIGKMISVNIVSIIQLIVMFLFAWLAFGLPIHEHIPLVILVIAMSAYACTSFGVLLATLARTRQQVQGLSTLVVLVMSAIGGSMMPTFIMPAFMQQLSRFSVNYWSLQSFYDVFWRSLSIQDPNLWKHLGMLILIGTLLNGLAFIFYRKQVQRLFS